MGHVPGRGLGEGVEALVGQDAFSEPAVGRIGLAAHQASCLKALDQVQRAGRDSDALARSASELIRSVRSGLSESLAMTWYSTIPSLESRRSC